jgi:hypothetical protein
MTVSSSFTSRETSLNGCPTRIACATPGMSPKRSSGSKAAVWPSTAMARRSAPAMGCGVNLSDRIFSSTASTSASIAAQSAERLVALHR